MAATPRTRFWIGPSGWSYDDWYGIVYPQPRPRGFKPLTHIARYFNATEINTSFYRIPSARMTAAWPPLVGADFRFALKLTRTFTHERSSFPPRRDVDAFREGARPLREAGVLGPLLIQFPWSYRCTPEAVDWLRRLADTFRDFDRFVEVRHASWTTDEGLDAIRAAGGYCNIDQPALHDCIGPTMHVFGDSAYVRFHGRNAPNWFADHVPAFERYNYLYSDDELRDWVRRLNAIAERAHDVYVFANNHYRGQGPANALELKALLGKAQVDAPDQLVAAFPRLREFVRRRPPASLFDELES